MSFFTNVVIFYLDTINKKDAFFMRLCKLHKNYFRISIVPPASSMAAFAFALTAFTLKAILLFSSPLPSTFTNEVWLIRPLIYKFSGENSIMPYFSIRWSIWPRLKTLYSILLMFLKPLFGNLLWIGI